MMVFGSDQGMCGQFNDAMAAFVRKKLNEAAYTVIKGIVLGTRVAARLKHDMFPQEKTYFMPASSAGITVMVGNLLTDIGRWSAEEGITQVLLLYHRPTDGARYHPVMETLLPPDPEMLDRLRNQPWPSKVIPVYMMEYRPLFSALLRQYFFVGMYRAFAQSMAAENAARLAAMQSAEKNIGDRLREITARYNTLRQTAITEELLDIIAGFEAVTNG
jgi:F-type H+-transporting ATPase subunit gamma